MPEQKQLPLKGGHAAGGPISAHRYRYSERELDDGNGAAPLDVIGSAKHRLARDYGYPFRITETALLGLYRRAPLAKAAIDHTILTCWQDLPTLRRTEEDPDPQEVAVAETLRSIWFWPSLREADRRALILGRAGLLLRVADGKELDQPVDRIRNGIFGLVEAVPIWGHDIDVVTRGTDPADEETYGKPLIYNVTEQDESGGNIKTHRVHHDRLVIVSRDGTLDCASELEAAYDAIIDVEKVRGAMAEAGWKNARMAFVQNLDKDAVLQAVGAVDEEDQTESKKEKSVPELLEDMQKRFNSKLDNSMLTQGMTTQVLNTVVGDLGSANAVAVEHLAGAFKIPKRTLVGSETGERAASEDALAWARVCQARRQYTLIPVVENFVRRLVRWGAIDATGPAWRVDWTDLTEATAKERREMVKTMKEVNAQVWVAGRRVAFTITEIRAAMGLEPITEEQTNEEIEAMNPEGVDDVPDPGQNGGVPPEMLPAGGT